MQNNELITYDITEPLKKGEFNAMNLSYAFNLDFHTNDTAKMKEFIHKTRFMRIRAKDLIFLSKDNLKGWTCRGWEFIIEFDFMSLELVKQNFNPGFVSCDPEDYISMDQDKHRLLSGDNGIKNRPLKKENIILREIFFVNVLAFIFNIMLTMQVIEVTIDMFRYSNLKNQKKRMYRWLLRNQKNFDIYVRSLYA